ncbi:MAG: MBL fold metallo-hydrolase [Rubrivivax sp.]|nr:MBL fold metallo-hydrolase [Rubrivivax sp.]
MLQPTIADRVEVLVLVDNVTDFLSSSPPAVEGELSRFWRRGARLQAGHLLCCAAHGFSCAITAWAGEKVRTLLFDAGPDARVLADNASRLGFEMGSVDALFLSHGHWDHAGGMLEALDSICAGNGGRPVPTYMHPGMYRSRAMKAPDGSMRPFADVPDAATLARHGAALTHATGPQLILDDLFFVSGEIPRVTTFEAGMPGQYRRTSDGLGWEPDPLLMDERFVAVRVRGKGTVVFSACSHAGIANVLSHATASLPGALHGVVGGLHLAGSTERLIPETVTALRGFGLQLVVPAHCTGWRAVGALATAFGDAVVPSAVGKTFRF